MLSRLKIAFTIYILLLVFGGSHAALAQTVINAGPMKPLLTGLISMGRGGYNPATNDNAGYGGIPGNRLDDITAKRNAFDGMVINIPWKEIEPAANQNINAAPIRAVLQQMRAYNADPHTTVPLRAILRVWAGANAPDWVKHMDGGPITVAARGPGTTVIPQTIAHFWSANYRNAWRNLQTVLANQFDAEPLIVEVANTSCTSGDDEWPALSWVGDKATGLSSINNLHAAGFNDAAFKNCLLQSAEDYNGWRTTYVNLIMGAFRPTDSVRDFVVPPKDYAFPQQLLQDWKGAFGERAVLANHILNFPPEENGIPVYALMKTADLPLEFQTHSPNGLDWANTVLETVCIGGNALELWNSTPVGGYVGQSPEALMAWSHQLKTTTSNELCPVLKEKYGI